MTPAEGIMGANPQSMGMILSFSLVALLLIFRNSRPRKVNLQRLWIRPAVAVLAVAVVFFRAPPALSLTNIAIMLAAVALGLAVGWQRGRLTQIEVHPDTHIITARVSAVGIVLVLGLMALRMFLRSGIAMPFRDGQMVATLGDGLMALAATTLIAQQLEIGVRARRIHQATVNGAKAASPSNERQPI